jgi:DNA-binding transcriptional LysR family regulator
VLNDAGEADALVTSMQSAPSGLLRISVATDFGVNHLSPVLGDFLRLYPDITVNMVLNNRYVELISEGLRHGGPDRRSRGFDPARPQALRDDAADDRRAATSRSSAAPRGSTT